MEIPGQKPKPIELIARSWTRSLFIKVLHISAHLVGVVALVVVNIFQSCFDAVVLTVALHRGEIFPRMRWTIHLQRMMLETRKRCATRA